MNPNGGFPPATITFATLPALMGSPPSAPLGAPTARDFLAAPCTCSSKSRAVGAPSGADGGDPIKAGKVAKVIVAGGKPPFGFIAPAEGGAELYGMSGRNA
eukprot:gene23576-49562_t